MYRAGLPQAQGSYDPAQERDSCGIGFVANIRNEKSHAIVRQGLQILHNLNHRGAEGADPLTGDGAGILIQVPDRFFREECQVLGMTLPAVGAYAVGMVFLPQAESARRACETIIEKLTRAEGQIVLGWRDLPVDNSVLSDEVRDIEPFVR